MVTETKFLNSNPVKDSGNTAPSAEEFGDDEEAPKELLLDLPVPGEAWGLASALNSLASYN